MVQTRAQAARPKFYVGLRRSPRAGTPAPYWTPIVVAPEASADGLSCDVFEMKAYRFNDNGEPIGYPDQPVGECIDGWPPAEGGKRARRTNRRRSNRRRTNRRRAGRR